MRQIVQPSVLLHVCTLGPQLQVLPQFGPHVVSEHGWHVRMSFPTILPTGQPHVYPPNVLEHIVLALHLFSSELLHSLMSMHVNPSLESVNPGLHEHVTWPLITAHLCEHLFSPHTVIGSQLGPAYPG